MLEILFFTGNLDQHGKIAHELQILGNTLSLYLLCKTSDEKNV